MASPLGLIWLQQLAAGQTIAGLAARWPEFSPAEIDAILATVRRRYPQAANHSK